MGGRRGLMNEVREFLGRERERGIERERIGVIPFGYVYGLMGVGLV